MGISSAGIGSGLDVNSLITQIMSAERVPLDLLKAKETVANARLSAFGTVKSAMATFQAALKTLQAGGLNAQNATSSSPTTFGATATDAATPGSYAITISQLARQAKQISGAVASPTTDFATGTLSIQVGTAPAISIPEGVYSLQGMSDAINKANTGVSASIVFDGVASHLSLTSTSTGVASDFTVAATGGLAQFDSTSASVTKQAALDANFTIDGLAVTSASNSVSTAIKGVTLNLAAVNATASTLTIARDDTKVKSNVNDFVKAYNALTTTVKGLTSYDAAAKKGAVLTGDSGALSVPSALRREISTAVASSGTITSLSSLGITSQRDGTLTVDDVKLSKAISTDAGNIARFFNNPDGLATRLNLSVTRLLDTTGVITSRTDGLTASIKSLQTQEEAVIVRLTQKETALRRQFTNLDTVLAGLQSKGAFLSAQLARL